MAHIHQNIDFVTEAFIVYKSKVLLVNHIGAGTWLPVGGHIELTEDPEEGLFREIEEEAGIKQRDLRIFSEKPKEKFKNFKFLYPPSFLDIHKIKEGHKHIGLIYFLKSATDKIKLKEDEHFEIKWFTKEEIEKGDILPQIKFYASKTLKIWNFV